MCVCVCVCAFEDYMFSLPHTTPASLHVVKPRLP